MHTIVGFNSKQFNATKKKKIVSAFDRDIAKLKDALKNKNKGLADSIRHNLLMNYPDKRDQILKLK